MITSFPILFALLLVRPSVVDSKFEQVAPPHAGGTMLRSPGQVRAVVLIHGYRIHFSEATVPRAAFHSWQRPHSRVVEELARDSDIFAFAYGQDRSLEEVVAGCGLDAAVRRLRALGYRDVVLVGHSAGGVIAREFVEDHPDAGVTKVIQVCCPNGGSPAAEFQGPKNQQAFLDCLTVQARQRCLRKRAGVCIPARVQFACLVGDGNGRDTDGVVPCVCQWTPDLQKQGIPAVAVHVSHYGAMRSPQGAEALAALVRTNQPRWDGEHVRAVRKSLLNE